MPIQIKEIVVKATVGSTSTTSEDSSKCSDKIEEIRNEIIDECLSIIFSQINKNNER